MSGVEVAGLVLGALPILIEAIDSYKSGVNKLKAGFKKRKVIEKLGRALRYQNSIIEGITRNVLAQSGCDKVMGVNGTQLRSLLQDQQTQRMVDDFLGTENAQVFSDALADCMASVSSATIGLASLVPALALVKNNIDVQTVLNVNAVSERGQVQFFARLSIVFKLEDLEQRIDALDRSTNSLDKFTRNVTANNQPGQNLPSRKAARLAKELQIVRENAINLHSALTRQWVTACHQRHELKVFLEDRIAELKSKQATDGNKTNRFEVAFVGATSHPTEFWHETLFHVEADDQKMFLPLQGSCIRFSTPQKPTTHARLGVQDICAAITDTIGTAHYPVFHLAGTGSIAMTLHPRAAVIAKSPPFSYKSLQGILRDHCDQSLPSLALPWKWRMALALRVASSFLQFIRTPWVHPSWSASSIYIPYTADQRELDLSRPFLSADFGKNSFSLANSQAPVKEDLLELGILLLEIWHENDIESRFAQQLGMNHTSFMRRACALQWLDDLQNPLPDLYFRAASHCISGLIIPDPRVSEWDHPDIWKSVCENIIDPLSKIARI